MPEHTYLAVALHGFLRPQGCFLYGVVLVVACKYLGVATLSHVKEYVVLQQVEQNLRSEYRPESHVIVCHLARRLFPLHVAVFLGCHRADLSQCHIAHHVEGIIHKQRWYKLLVVPQLQIGFAGIRLLTTG